MGRRKVRPGGLGEMVEQARLRRGWTQRELGERLGVSDAYISAIETNARRWPQEYVESLARVLGLNQARMALAAGLITELPEALGARPVPAVAPHQERLLAVTAELHPEALAVLVRTAELMAAAAAGTLDEEWSAGPEVRSGTR